MADVRPFRGLRYAATAVADLSAVVTPPYDVIDPAAQARYLDRDPHNIIRLELGQDQPNDDRLDNRYTRAAALFARWRLDGTMQIDPQPAFYLYRQSFAVAGTPYVRTSVLARVRLQPWEDGVILPHEQTLAKPKDDRLKLLRATTANLSPIMALFDDPKSVVGKLLAKTTKTKPAVEFTDDAGEVHTLWLVTDPTVTAKISAAFADQQLFIADGHHRYETALAFRDEVSELHRGLTNDEAAHFVLMALVATNDPGLIVLPTHRTVRAIAAQRLTDLETALAANWTLEPLDATLDAEAITAKLHAAGQDATSVAAVVAMRDHLWLARLTPAGHEHMHALPEPAAWQALDVAIAQELIIEACLGITRDVITTGDQISYVRDAAQALADVTSGAAQVAILLNATRPEQVRDVAKAGGRMPQKSTFFYPKLITGAVINPIW